MSENPAEQSGECELLRPEDVELFVRVCDEIGSHPSATLQDIAELVDVKPTTLSQAIARVERLVSSPGSRVRLIKRTQKIGVVGVTLEGGAYRDKFRKALVYWKDLHAPIARDFVPLTVGTTSALRRFVLPGAVAAFVIYLRSVGHDDEHDIRLEEGNFADLIQGIRRGAYQYAVGWELPKAPADPKKPGSTPYPDIEQIALLREPVRFGAIIGLDEVRKPADDDLAELFGVRRGDRLPPAEAPITFGDLKRRLPGKSLALLRSEPDPVLDELRRAADITRLIWVDHYEDVISFVQMGLASLGWVPQFYHRPDTSLFHFRTITGADGKEVGRQVVVYRSRGTTAVKESVPPGEGESATEGAGEIEKLRAKSGDLGDMLLTTIKLFLSDSERPGDKGEPIEKSIRTGQRIKPMAVERWAKTKLKKEFAARFPQKKSR